MEKALKFGRLLSQWRPELPRRAAAVVLLATTGLLLACGGESQPADSTSPSAGQPAAATEARLRLPKLSPPQPPAPAATPQTLTGLQVEARQVLADRLSVPAAGLELVSDEPVQWGDTSLGCPQAGMFYAQVITPGHRITFRQGEDTYEVHTASGEDGGPKLEPVSCE